MLDIKKVSLEAGRELDALVAEKVMGWIWLRFKEFHNEVGFIRKPYGPDTWEASLEDKRATGDEPLAHLWDYDLPHYSTDITAAWEVVQWMIENAHPVGLAWHKKGTDCGWHCHMGVTAYAKTAPLAICCAALLAVTKG